VRIAVVEAAEVAAATVVAEAVAVAVVVTAEVVVEVVDEEVIGDDGTKPIPDVRDALLGVLSARPRNLTCTHGGS
jgi:hypothetical protein